MEGSVLYPTWLLAMATMRWGRLKPARVPSLGTGKESVFPNTPWFPNTPCRVATRMITTAPTPRMSPDRRSDWPGWGGRTALALRISELEECCAAEKFGS
jgi:hypothetical protein